MVYIIYNTYKLIDLNPDADVGRKPISNPVYKEMP